MLGGLLAPAKSAQNSTIQQPFNIKLSQKIASFFFYSPVPSLPVTCLPPNQRAWRKLIPLLAIERANPIRENNQLKRIRIKREHAVACIWDSSLTFDALSGEKYH